MAVLSDGDWTSTQGIATAPSRLRSQWLCFCACMCVNRDLCETVEIRHTEPFFFVRRTDTNSDTAFFERQLYVLQHGGTGTVTTHTATIPVLHRRH